VAAKRGAAPVFAQVAASFVRVSRSSIDQDLRIAGLPESVRKLLRGTPLALRQRALLKLARLDDPRTQEELAAGYEPGKERAFLQALGAVKGAAQRSSKRGKEDAIRSYRRACARLAELGVSREEAEEPGASTPTKEMVLELLRQRHEGRQAESEKATETLRTLLRAANPMDLELFLDSTGESYLEEPEGQSDALMEDIEMMLKHAADPVSVERVRGECARAASKAEDPKVRSLLEEIAGEVQDDDDTADLRDALEELQHVVATGQRFPLRRNLTRIVASVLGDHVMSFDRLRKVLKDRGHTIVGLEYVLKLPPFERIPGPPVRFRVQPDAIFGPYGWVRATADTSGPHVTVADVVELEALDVPERERQERYSRRRRQRASTRNGDQAHQSTPGLAPSTPPPPAGA
jgi:hypothetical protein